MPTLLTKHKRRIQMFQVKGYCVDFVKEEDLPEVVAVYNSNREFLLAHMDQEIVTEEWAKEEFRAMDEIGFNSCKIMENSSGKIIGVMDFRLGKETYLSLMMLHKDYRGNGLGNLIFQAFEEYVKAHNSKAIRIDVVTNYDSSVLDFWVKKGFVAGDVVGLNWTGKLLPALTLRKNLI